MQNYVKIAYQNVMFYFRKQIFVDDSITELSSYNNVKN